MPNTQEQISFNSTVVRFGRLEELVAELTKHNKQPLVRFSQRSVIRYDAPVSRTTAYVVVTAIDDAETRQHPTIYFWYGVAGWFDEMQHRPFSDYPYTRPFTAQAVKQNVEALKEMVAAKLAEKGGDVRDGFFWLPDSYFNGYGTTNLLNLMQAYENAAKGIED